jgi:hypothetical protein
MIRYDQATARSMLTTLNTLVGGNAVLRFYSGDRPLRPGLANTRNVLLAEVGLASPPFTPSADGKIRVRRAKPDLHAAATGVPAWACLYDGHGHPLCDFSAGGPASGADIRFATESIIQGAHVTLTDLTISLTP